MRRPLDIIASKLGPKPKYQSHRGGARYALLQATSMGMMLGLLEAYFEWNGELCARAPPGGCR